MKSHELEPVGFRLEFRPGDPCYYSPEDLKNARLSGNDQAAIWGLFEKPQPGCSSKIEVYKGWCWVQPQYKSAVKVMTDFKSLYIGPEIRVDRSS